MKSSWFARFADKETGDAEPFLGSFTFETRPQAQRLADWIQARLTIPNGRDTLEVEVFQVEHAFKVRAAWIGDGDMDEICP